MLLIEKVVKLLDDFHFDIFRNYIKNLSIRSYYPLALIDVVSRDLNIKQDSEQLFRDVYAEPPTGEKDMKKFFQLGHYTFKLSSYLARNYPTYLQHNISRIQHLINTGYLEKATKLAEILLDVSEKVEDHSTEIKTLSFLAQRENLLEPYKVNTNYYERINVLLGYQKATNDLNFFISKHLKTKGKEKGLTMQEELDFLKQYHKNDSLVVSMISRLQSCYVLYNHRHETFYAETTFKELVKIEKELEKNDYVIFPFLYNLRAKLSFLKLINYTIKQTEVEKMMEVSTTLINDSEVDLFWNSLINLPEINAIALQTSYYVSNHFTTYRDDHLEKFPPEAREEINYLKNRCQTILNNKILEEKFVVRYINLSTIYAGLLMLGDEKDVKESINTLEKLLIFFQQVPFHSFIDAIYSTLIMAEFCLKNYDQVEKAYRRYKKSTTGKIVNPENDLALHGFYFASKWIETNRSQYVKKLALIITEIADKPRLKSTYKMLLELSDYFKIPLPLKK